MLIRRRWRENKINKSTTSQNVSNFSYIRNYYLIFTNSVFDESYVDMSSVTKCFE